MHPRTAKKILDDDDNFDVAMVAEALAEQQKEKEKPIPSKSRALSAFLRKKLKEREELEWRKTFAKVWNKKKSI